MNEFNPGISIVEPHELERHVPQLVILDFDRTLSSVEASTERLHAVSQMFGISSEELSCAKADRTPGTVFDALGYIKQRLDATEFEELKQSYLAAGDPLLLYEDADRLLARLDQASVAHRVLSYGTNPEWKELKIRASGYRGPFEVVSYLEKGVAIGTMRSNTGYRDILNGGTIAADSVCLVDDRASSFRGLPLDCMGYLIQRENTRPSQAGDVSDNVRAIRTLDDLVVVDGGLVAKGCL